jgi:uncharacterized protein (DUF983 family)
MSNAMTDTDLRPVLAGLKCCCPRCGKGSLFKGYLTIRPSCEVCDLDFSFADPADGPAFFVMSAVSFLVVAIWTGWVIADHPPVWLELIVVMPAMVLGCLGGLRPAKAWLVASQYFHQARDIDFSKPNEDGSFSQPASIGRGEAAD